jgi:aromatic-L-amino-acid decarboxylase
VPLELTPEQFRRVAEEITRIATEYLDSLPARPSLPANLRGDEVKAVFAEALPQHGQGMAALADLQKIIERSRPNSPRFFAYVMGSGEPVSAAADLLASVLNQNVTSWRSGPAAATLEWLVVGWLAEAIGCAGFTGSLCGGGSAANLMALAMARESRMPSNEAGAQSGVVYCSDEAHMSIGKAVALLGLGRENLRTIAVDANFRMNTAELQHAIQHDRKAGKRAIAIVATAGTVNTGAIDPLREIASIAREHNLWFHVDGAFGALAAIAILEKFGGLEVADSLSLDPHKWLHQPVDCGCLLFRDAKAAQTAFSHSGDYARSLTQDPLEGFAFFEESLELSRRFRALKLWLSLRYHGLNAFREAIIADLQHAKQLAEMIDAEPRLERVAPVDLSAVCFRYKGKDGARPVSTKLQPFAETGLAPSPLRDGDALNRAILHRVVQRGRVYLSNATIHGQFALRACFMNHRTTREDVRAVVDEVIAAAAEVSER